MINKQWLQQKIAEMEEHRDLFPGDLDDDHASVLSAFRIALASLEAEAVAFRSKLQPPSAIGSEHWDYTDHRQPDAFELENCSIECLYIAPPAPVSVPVAYIRDERGRMMLDGKPEPRIGYGGGWNACRSAMLQGADQQQNEQQNIPKIIPFEQWLSQQTGTIDVECGCVMTEVFFHWLRVAYEAGNSPVISDGYALVPVEPTEKMLNAWLSEVANWRGHVAGYKAMLAAAPQQEVTQALAKGMVRYGVAMQELSKKEVK